ncbi:uncharacterized protein LOC131659083 [Vicia villosa]|uniref:uncharacterized protein LOC131659083 n=1 Tax=Vicia villosa TaxID=3911 RepID=UPI00273B0AA7|nr:uncharacterized protein LOC131659083 [Vicia villosa]
MEGLTALVRKAVNLDDFKPFSYGDVDHVDIIQFADDTIILGEASTKNLWSLKVLLRGFEMVSGLKINFSKSNVFGVNVDEVFMNTATSFLDCKKGVIPFLFLGISVGEKPRRRRMWTRVINNLKSRLTSWKGRNLSIGGRVILINAVLNAIPSFTLSFYKVPGMVLKEIKSLLSNFLWSGNVNKRCIHWVKWKTVQARYEDVCKPKDSSWWRDIISNDVKVDFNEDGFSSCVQSILKEGNHVLFWYSLWLGDQTLRIKFPDLFELTTNKLGTVADVLLWANGEAGWNIKFLFGAALEGLLQAAALSFPDSGSR